VVKRGFTFIEASVVVMLIVIAAVFITPSFSRMKADRARDDFKNGLPNVVALARETAIINGSAVDLQYDENDNQMQIVAASSQNGSSVLSSTPQMTSSGINSGSTPSFTEKLPTDVNATDFKMPSETTTTTAAWSVRFYPDGTAEPAGIEFNYKDDSYSLVVNANAWGKVVSGGIPDLTADKWAAGTYVQRSQ
jgi:type II secretory pathway pseudopilin PulG